MKWNSQKQSEKYFRKLVKKGGLVEALPNGELVGRMVAKEAVRKRKSAWEFKVNKKTNCWDWLRSIHPHGYGAKRHKAKTMPAHRFFYKNLVKEIPRGLELDHLCRNRCCVNPAHLEPVTTVENIRRGVGPRINMGIARDIRFLRKEFGMRTTDIAYKFGIQKQLVRRVINNNFWKEV